MHEHILIEAVTPCVDNGRYAAKRVVGERCHVTADIFRDGHDLLLAQVCWRALGNNEPTASHPLRAMGNDAWEGAFPLGHIGPYVFHVEAWTDVFGTWLADLKKKVDVGMTVKSEVAEGVAWIENVAKHASSAQRQALLQVANDLRAATELPTQALALASSAALEQAMHAVAPRADIVRSAQYRVYVDRTRGAYGSWYEFFPRSQGKQVGQACTLRDAVWRLADVRDMGFDVIYLPPVHPIGTAHRKGVNNSLTAGPDDPGSPWAIGNTTGGHTAIEPALGTLADFDYFVKKAQALELEVAIDFAIQCSPDHPWVKQHPDWFYRRPDGTIKYAENPPKKYQDVYHVNFDTADKEALWQALLNVLLFWIDHNIKIFRVDNPAYQTVCVLGVGHRPSASQASGRGIFGRGIHPSQNYECPGQARLHPVIHVLHLAQYGRRIARVYDAAVDCAHA